jgi:translation initiation factor IF-2
MTEIKATRLSKIARELNVGITTIVEYLHKKGHHIESDPNTKITPEQYNLLAQEYSSDLNEKKKSENFSLKNLREKKESITLEDIQDTSEPEEEEESLLIKDTSAQNAPKHEKKQEEKPVERPVEKAIDIKVVGKVDLDSLKTKKPKAEEVKTTEKQEKKPLAKKAGSESLKEAPKDEKEITETARKAESGIKVVGKIDLEAPGKKSKSKPKTGKEEGKTPADSAEITGPENFLTEEVPDATLSDEFDEELLDIIPEVDENMIPTRFEKLTGPTVIGFKQSEFSGR